MNARDYAGGDELRSPLEAELRRSEAIRRVLTEATGSVVWVMPPSGEFEDEEPAWEALTGQTFEAYRGSGWLGAVHPDDRQQAAAAWRSAFEAQKPCEAECRLRSADGRDRTVIARAAPVRSGSGEVVEWVWVLTDVTEQRQEVEALRSRAAALQAVTDNTADVIARVGPDLRYLFVNQAIESTTGLTPEAVVGRTIGELGVPTARAELAEAHVRNVFETGRLVRYEFTHEAPPAAARTFSAALTPERGADGAIGSVLIVTSDITEVRAVTDALHASERHLRQLLEAIADAFFALDEAFRFTYVNGEAERFLGRRREDLLGQYLLDAFPELGGTPIPAEFERARRDNVVVQFTELSPVFRKWYEVRAYPYEGGLAIFFTDVTARREREADFLLLRQAVEASANGILITDATQADNPLIYVNPAFTAITGYRRDEVIGRNCRFLQGDAHDQEGLDELRRALQEHRTVSVLLENYRKDGTLFCNELHVDPVLGENGRLLNHVGVMTDVTERVEAERRQRESAETLRALTRRVVDVQEQERRAVALELHDEIGQVLTALKFTLDHADRTPTMPSKRILRDAREMVRALQDQVRNLSLDLRPSMLDDLGLVPALVWLFERVEQKMRLSVRFTAPELLPPVSRAVATAAFRIVQEALTNVVRHAGVTEAEVMLRVEEERLVLEVTIADEGTGFDPSSRAEATTGLSGMHERASVVGGSLAVEARPGGGTVVRARLPLGPETP